MNAREVKGTCYMALAMLMVPLVDGIAKYLSADYSPIFIAWARYLIAAVLVLPISILLFGYRCIPQDQLGMHLLRTVLLVSAMSCYFVAIALIPMATAISTYFIAPVVATLIAVFFSGETLTGRKSVALVFGFVGMLIIVRPDQSIHYGIYFSLASGVLFGVYLAATRAASRATHPVKVLCFQCVAGTLLLLPFASLFCLLGVFSAGSHFLSIYALKLVETSVLAPLVYLELLGSVVVGYLLFAELPAVSVWIGVSLIVSAGLLVVKVKNNITFSK